MIKKTLFLLLSLILLANTCFGFTDDPQVPEDEFIVKIEVNIMPRNVAFYYDTNRDGIVDVIFYFPIIEDYLAKASEANKCNWKRSGNSEYAYCEAVVDNGDHWLVYMADIGSQPVYMVIKNFTAFEYAVTPSGKIQGVEQTFKDIKKYIPELDPQHRDLMDFSEAQ